MVKVEYGQPRWENYHEESQLISQEEIKILEAAFDKAWCSQTMLPGERADFDENDPSYSQCFVTALVVQCLLGGEIIEGVIPQDPDNYHAWNRIGDGTEHDFDRKQFPANFRFEMVKFRTAGSLLMSPRAAVAETKERFLLLLDRVVSYLPEELAQKWLREE